MRITFDPVTRDKALTERGLDFADAELVFEGITLEIEDIRKVRWSREGSGKSGGVRVIYFTRLAEGEVVLLTLYAKSKTDNLTGAKLKEIRRALEE